MYYCMKCGEIAPVLHESVGLLATNGTQKKIPLMICTQCYNDLYDPLPDAQARQSKIAFAVWKTEDALAYADHEGISLDVTGILLQKLQTRMFSVKENGV